MKKLIVALMLMLLTCGVAFADGDLGIQIIGNTSKSTAAVSLDDMQLGQEYIIDGYAGIVPESYGFVDCYAQYAKGEAGNNKTEFQSYILYNSTRVACDARDSGYYYSKMSWQESGRNADFAWLVLEITNRQKHEVNLMKEATVKVIFEDDYEFTGWTRQFNFDYNTFVHRYVWDYPFASPAVLNPADEMALGMLYTNTYVFGCTLPNAVVEGKEPLRMEITLGDNVLTYHIRK